MGRRRKDGSSKELGLGRGGIKPPNTKGMKHKKKTPYEEDLRRFNDPDGAPTKYDKIDFEQLEQLCSIGCTMREVCSCLDLDDETISKAIKIKYGLSWKEFFAEHSNKFKTSLRRLQYRSAEGDFDEDGNKYRVFPSVPMQIWLGKQYLGQTDKQELDVGDKKNIPMFEWADAEDITDQKELEDRHNLLEDGDETEESEA